MTANIFCTWIMTYQIKVNLFLCLIDHHALTVYGRVEVWYYVKEQAEKLHVSILNFFKDLWPCIVTDSLWIKPTDAPISNFIGITTLHVSGSLSAHHQEFLAVHRLWYILCSCDDRLLPGTGWNCSCNSSSILFLVANGHHNCIKCTKADVRLRTPDDGQKGCPKLVESKYQ
jgi:hypothetical protein